MNCGNYISNNLMDKVNRKWLANIVKEPSTFEGSGLTKQEMRNLKNSGVVSKVGYNAKKQNLYGPGPKLPGVLAKMKENGEGV